MNGNGIRPQEVAGHWGSGPTRWSSRFAGGLVFFVTLASIGLSADPPSPITIDDFEHGLGSGWEKKEFQGSTEYTIFTEDGGGVLRAESRNSAAGLIYEKRFDSRQYPILSWRWKVENLVQASDPTQKAGDDYAARVYVVFPHWFPPKTRSLNYIWATRFPKGDHIPNPFFANAVMIAVESGGENVGRWVTERRNIREDYRKVFGEDPPLAGAVAIMTDTDQTGESVVAYYDDLRLEPRP